MVIYLIEKRQQDGTWIPVGHPEQEFSGALKQMKARERRYADFTVREQLRIAQYKHLLVDCRCPNEGTL